MNVLIADDHSIVRTGVKHILELHPSVNKIYEANNGEDALKFINDYELDLVILDLSMPKVSGLEVLKRGIECKPEIQFLILSMHPEKEYAIRVLKYGAAGYLTKDCLNEELNKAIDVVLSGKKYVSSNISNVLLGLDKFNTEKASHESLSEREFEVFLMLASGKKPQEIADKLFLSIKTISTYKSRLLKKLNLRSVSDLTRYAIQKKLIE